MKKNNCINMRRDKKNRKCISNASNFASHTHLTPHSIRIQIRVIWTYQNLMASFYGIASLQYSPSVRDMRISVRKFSPRILVAGGNNNLPSSSHILASVGWMHRKRKFYSSGKIIGKGEGNYYDNLFFFCGLREFGQIDREGAVRRSDNATYAYV